MYYSLLLVGFGWRFLEKNRNYVLVNGNVGCKCENKFNTDTMVFSQNLSFRTLRKTYSLTAYPYLHSLSCT